ncbi:MAG: Para-hydroxybenzoate--polyprenyltransferase, mitochondrial precursor (PHB:polyprenyltransferase) [Claussenomyces sp. TS43310]|nr:MAG: Para-hydroxybenzoate--polyprenyltransferase, mitochondrial precursor (PHB:polyprenyltransferase) [Claussenomyces sp. TS43310]
MIRNGLLTSPGSRTALTQVTHSNSVVPTCLKSNSTRMIQASNQAQTQVLSSHRTSPWNIRRTRRNQYSVGVVTTKPAKHPSISGESYAPPTTGILSALPSSWVPYAELIRMDKPTGTYYLFFPCIFSTLLAAPLATPMATPSSVIGFAFLFFSGAIVMRGAGCTINDLWDRNLDPHVRRTRLRPIARGAVTPFKALVFTGAQLLTGLVILVQFPPQCLWYGIPSLLFVASYPLAKRVTHYPQIILGLTFSWGAFMGFPALGIDLLQNSAAMTAGSCLYASNVAWTVLYDMIYAHMDIKDDAKAGIKSIALRHNEETKRVLSGLAVVQISLLATAGVASGAGPAFFITSCGGAALSLAVMIKRVNLKSVKDCWWWFVNGCWITGGTISAGMGLEYAIRYVG